MRGILQAWAVLAAASSGISVAMGAFAAHGVADPNARDWLRTGANYEMSHALAVFACLFLVSIGAHRARLAPAFFLAGAALFSGSLYAMALGAPRWLGAVTPMGGGLFMIGWGVLAWAALGIAARERV
jgi:uncharacterized membrane protein YgdD (TMEM256/DUF423 family)